MGSVCGTAEVVWKPRFLWQWPSAHLHFLVSCFSFSSWQYPIDSLWGSGLVSLLASQAHQHHGHLTNFGCQIPENEICIFKKLVSRRKHEVLQNFLVNGCSDVGFQKTQCTNTSRWHCTPNHRRLWKLNTGLQATWAMSFSTLPPDSGTLVSKWNTKLALIWKEDFGILGNSPVLLLLSPGKTPLRTTVAKFLDKSVCGGSWCLDPSLSPFLVKFTQILESILLDNPHKAAVLSVGCDFEGSGNLCRCFKLISWLACHHILICWDLSQNHHN